MHIPSNARFYGFLFPQPIDIPGESLSSHRVISRKDIEEAGVNASDPFVHFLTVGAYCYFDHEYNIVAINAISFDAITEDEATRNPAKRTPGTMCLGAVCALPPTVVQPLRILNRWLPVTAKVLLDHGFEEFAWVCPSEFLGDHIYSMSGGFALGSRIWGQKMGSEGSRLAESERGVWFWLNRHSICTPHFNRKNELILFRGRETVSTPKFWSPGFAYKHRSIEKCVPCPTLRVRIQVVCAAVTCHPMPCRICRDAQRMETYCLLV